MVKGEQISVCSCVAPLGSICLVVVKERAGGGHRLAGVSEKIIDWGTQQAAKVGFELRLLWFGD